MTKTRHIVDNIDVFGNFVNGNLEQEENSVLDYCKTNMDKFENLNKEIKSCDKILEQMGVVVQGFEENLAKISEEIQTLQSIYFFLVGDTYLLVVF